MKGRHAANPGEEVVNPSETATVRGITRHHPHGLKGSAEGGVPPSPREPRLRGPSSHRRPGTGNTKAWGARFGPLGLPFSEEKGSQAMVTLTRPRPAAGRNPRAKGEILARLRSAEGHLRGIHRMINEDRYSVDVLKQTKAVQRAIDKVNVLVLERHLNHCVSGGIRLEDPQERERVVSELLDVLEDGTGNKR